MNIVFDKTIPLIEELFAPHNFSVTSTANLDTHTIRNAEVIITRSTTLINQELLKGSPVKIVGTVTSGIDHIDTRYLKDNHIQLLNAPGCNARSVCDYVFLAIYAYYKRLHDLSIGIVGVGHVGRQVLAAAKRLNMKAYVYDPPRTLNDPTFTQNSLEQVLSADIVTLHTPLNKSGAHKTLKLVDKYFLKAMSNNSLFINAARGAVCDEDALINGSETIAKVLDVYCDEPFISEALIKQAFIATPHIAGHSIEAKLRGSLMIYHQILQKLKIEPKQTPLDHLLLNSETIYTKNSLNNYQLKNESEQLKSQGPKYFKSIRQAHKRHEI